jgi:hypothetical protein
MNRFAQIWFGCFLPNLIMIAHMASSAILSVACSCAFLHLFGLSETVSSQTTLFVTWFSCLSSFKAAPHQRKQTHKHPNYSCASFHAAVAAQHSPNQPEPWPSAEFTAATA